MGKFIKTGRVVVVLQGRQAGKKAIVVKTYDDGTKARPFGHCLVAGVDRPPMKVHKGMSKKKIAKRSRVKPFIKYINYNHIMPTRYQVPAELGAQSLATDQQMDTPDGRTEAKKFVKNLLQEKFVDPAGGQERQAVEGRALAQEEAPLLSGGRASGAGARAPADGGGER
eukprot:CAMPEP_0204569726 /NCGR_PEP_ID=MMETSP0661-20131031/37909_1 /ASSEMBLY_ACC=CAM_ASM_000606 /TAXON_ID=109239 /ORGANISM="Alexandrium margalefi, Strain AMGDE01CS-322" /LENGTH=168 /DNA_ID=CAMNT_0051577853 /DNA_START=65 /DNA_END=566 /DNA_ORIENTATION=+